MFSHLSLGLRQASLSVSDVNHITSNVDNDDAQQLSLQLGRLFQAMCAFAQVSAGHLLSMDDMLSTPTEDDIKDSVDVEADQNDPEAQISRLARLHLDPVSATLGVIDLIKPQSPLVDLLTRLAAAKQKIQKHKRGKGRKDKSSSEVAKLAQISHRKRDKFVKAVLENRVLEVVFGFSVGECQVLNIPIYFVAY